MKISGSRDGRAGTGVGSLRIAFIMSNRRDFIPMIYRDHATGHSGFLGALFYAGPYLPPYPFITCAPQASSTARSWPFRPFFFSALRLSTPLSNLFMHLGWPSSYFYSLLCLFPLVAAP
jgi:hypothetical protein